MKTIELLINGQKAQFTTKSVTLNGKEYFYSKITKLDHSPIVHTYKMECEGEEMLLTYEKKDAKILAAIFSQVNKMIELKKAKAAEAKAEAKGEAKAEAKAEEAPAGVDVKEALEEKTEEAPAESSDVMDEMVKATIALNEERAKKEAEKAAKKARKKAIKEAKNNGTPLPEEVKEENSNENAAEDAAPVDPAKQAKLKKSLTIFGIVLAAIIAASLIYYFVFGTSNAPTDSGPGVTESQQYEDIDQLIEDLE